MYRTTLREKAITNNLYRKGHFDTEIKHSCDKSVVYGLPSNHDFKLKQPIHENTKIDIVEMAIGPYLLNRAGELNGKTAVLNFASYKNPGGAYMKGSDAQEEAICHCTTLYEVLERQSEYYAWNNEHKNKGMYENRLLYTPDILVLDDSNNVRRMVDVMTCAAPNMSVGLKYGSFTEEECQRLFKKRINFMMSVAAYNGVDNLILGAWGCGVFKNDPEFVAKAMLREQEVYDKYFKNIIYVILKGDNCDTFLRVAASS